MNDATIDVTAVGGGLRDLAPDHPGAVLAASTGATPGPPQASPTLHADATADAIPVVAAAYTT